MKKKVLALTIVLAISSIPGVLQAEGNANAGKAKAGSCSGCHGGDGNSMMSMFPKLAEQHTVYLNRQLQAFKDGSRIDASMQPIVTPLSKEDISDISAYYAGQKISANKLPVVESDDEEEGAEEAVNLDELLASGGNLYRNGNLESEVSACIACHGPFGEGNKHAGFPMLKSQHADYLIKSLNDFKSGTRNKNPDNVMHMIAKKMSDEEIKAVSYHISMMK